MAKQLGELYEDLCSEFGLKARLIGPLLGRYIHWTLGREAKRLKAGWTYEPPTFYERNYVDEDAKDGATVIKSVPGLALTPSKGLAGETLVTS